MFTVWAVVAALPIAIVVAAPPIFSVVCVVFNKFPVIALEPAIVIVVAPFKFNAVAFVPVIVAFQIVSVPVEAPRFSAVAAPPIFNVVAVVFSKSNDVETVVRLVVMLGDVKVFTPVNV